MHVVIISSTEDPAGTNIKNALLETSSWDDIDRLYGNPVYQHNSLKDIIMVTITDRTIRHEHIDREIEDKLAMKLAQAIFISRHRSNMGMPTLTVHPIGNYRDAQFGGKPNTLVTSAPRFMTYLLQLMKKYLEQTSLQYQVCYEVTHHGPYLDIPTLFAEVGSTEHEWKKKEPATVIAQALSELFTAYRCEQDLPCDIPVLIGVGGGHYAPRFTEMAFTQKIAFGHMIPSYHLKADATDQELFIKALATTPQVTGVYLHKKELKKSQVSTYTTWFQDRGIPVLSSSDLPNLM